MSFEAFKFAWSPPPTVPLAPISVSTSISRKTSGLSTNSSRATSLIAQFANLQDTANYLKTVILSLTQGIVITVDPNTDPSLSNALSVLYQGQVPPAISIPMYAYNLAAEVGGAQLNLALGLDSTVEANPFQQQALTTINKAVESQLVASGSFLNQAALLLRGLTGDATVYAQQQAILSQYPAANPVISPSNPSGIPAATIDVGDDVHAAFNTQISIATDNYGVMYSTLVQPNTSVADAASSIAMYAQLSANILLQIGALFDFASSVVVKHQIADLQNGVATNVYPQMLTQATGQLCMLDQLQQMMTDPIGRMNSPLSSTLSAVQQSMSVISGVIRNVAEIHRQTSGPLAGMPLTNSSQTLYPSSYEPPTILGDIAAGLLEMVTLIDWSLQQANASMAVNLDAFQRLVARSQGDTSTQLQLMTVSGNMQSQSSMAKAVASQPSSSSIATVSSQTQIQTVGAILDSSDTGNGSTYTVQNGTVSVTPPAVPPPTAGAAAILGNAGVNTQLSGITETV